MFKVCVLLSNGGFAKEGPAAAELILKLVPNLAGFVQTRALPEQPNAAFSGMAEMWFADPGEAASMENQLDVVAQVLEDAAEIHSVIVGMDRVVMRSPAYGRGPQVKGVYPFCRKEGMPVADFQKYWWQTHGPIAALTESALSYMQIHPLAQSYENGSPAFDGITEISWPSRAAAEAALGSRQMTEDQGGDAPNFVDLDSVALFLAEEEIVIAP